MTSSDIHTASCFFKTLADFFPHQRLIAPHGLTRNRPRWDSRNSPWKSEVAERRLFFLNELLGPFFAVFKSWWWFFLGGFCPPIWNGEKSSSDFFTGFFGGWCVTGFQKQVPCSDFTTIFTQTYLLVVEIITYKKHQFNGTTLNPSKTTM